MISIVPLNDEKDHLLTAECWCDPEVEWLDPETGLPWESGDGPRVIHNAADGREIVEELTGEKWTPEKTWKCIVD